MERIEQGRKRAGSAYVPGAWERRVVRDQRVHRGRSVVGVFVTRLVGGALRSTGMPTVVVKIRRVTGPSQRAAAANR
ncbi:MFS transporter [Streptomyces hygroscopicus]|nr:MFS transporter [Streptomyces hygroscopicus]